MYVCMYVCIYVYIWIYEYFYANEMLYARMFASLFRVEKKNEILYPAGSWRRYVLEGVVSSVDCRREDCALTDSFNECSVPE